MAIVLFVSTCAPPRAGATAPPAFDASESAPSDDDVGWRDLPSVASTSTAADTSALPLERTLEPSAPFELVGSVRENAGFAHERLETSPWVLGRSTVELAGVFHRGPFLVELGLHAELDAAYLAQEGSFDGPTRAVYGWSLRPWEAYAEYRSGPVSLRFGRQISAWGDALLLPLLDLPNPRDRRLPGFGDLGGDRVPLTMTRLTLDHEAHRFELLAVHEVDYEFLPPPMSLYSPIPQILRWGAGVRDSGFFELASGREFEYRHELERFSFESQQVLARYRYMGSRVEFGVYWGIVASSEGVIRLPGPADWTGTPVSFPVEHSRYGVAGASVLFTRGEFVGFANALVDIERPLTAGDLDATPPIVGAVRQSWTRYTVGLRYTRLEHGFVALEHSYGFRVDRPRDGAQSLMLLFPLAPPAIALIYQQRFLRERLEVELTAGIFGDYLRGGSSSRLRLSVHPADGWGVTLAYTLFVPLDRPSPIAGFTQHDRLDLGLRWDFALD